MKLDPRFKNTEFTVEADSFAKHTLWQNYAKEALDFRKEFLNSQGLIKELKLRHEWKDDSMGTVMQIGEIDKRPICVTFFWTKIDGHLVMFYDITSQLADHKMMEDWLKKYCNPQHEGRSSNCDASNFHHCLDYINTSNASNPKSH